MLTKRAISTVLMSTMLIGCAERIVEPTADVTIKVEHADGRTEYQEFSRAEINTARASMPRDFTGIDTAGVTFTKFGSSYVIAKNGRVLTTVTRDNGSTIVTTENAKYTIRGELPAIPVNDTHENVTLATAALPCWVWGLMWLAGVASLLTCVTVVGCAAALATLAGVIDGFEDDNCFAER